MAFLGLRYALEQWASMGMFDVLLPFILVFAIIFSILQRTKILGESKQINSAVAGIISLFVIMNPYVTALFIPIFSQAGLALIILIAVMVVVGLLFNVTEVHPALKWVLVVFGIGMAVWLLSAMENSLYAWFPISSYWWDANKMWFIPVMLAAVIIGLIVFGPGKSESKPVKAAG